MTSRAEDKMNRTKVAVSEQAAISRINRKLSHEGEMLRKSRARWVSTVGDFYVVDRNGNFVVRRDVNPEQIARELAVLRAHETVAAWA
jgi:N-acetylglutamate synthase-like GNAT family acetyltransferase